MMDNMSFMLYINKQEGTRSSLCTEAIKFWNWCIAHHIHISVVHLAGTPQSMLSADTSPTTVNGSWVLRFSMAYSRDDTARNQSFHHLQEQEVSSFSVQGRSESPILWRKSLFYAFPPAPIILRVLNKIRQEKARVILLVLPGRDKLGTLNCLCPAINRAPNHSTSPVSGCWSCASPQSSSFTRLVHGSWMVLRNTGFQLYGGAAGGVKQ